MEKIIAGRHLELTDEERQEAWQTIGEELEKIEKGYQKLTTARVVVDMQKTWFSVEVILNGKNIDFEASATAKDLHAAIDSAMAKARKQLRKFMDKVHDHHHQKSVSEIELDNETRPTES